MQNRTRNRAKAYGDPILAFPGVSWRFLALRARQTPTILAIGSIFADRARCYGRRWRTHNAVHPARSRTARERARRRQRGAVLYAQAAGSRGGTLRQEAR